MQSARTKIDVSVRDQRLILTRDGEELRSYPISTSRFGIGTQEGSMKTPLGRFRIVEKIGDSAAPGTIFKARVALGPDDPPPDTEDFITSRILWLDGLEEENANTRDRFIYIHGTKHEDEIGTPASHGCIRIPIPSAISVYRWISIGDQIFVYR